MKRYFIFGLMLIAAISLILSGCATSTSPTTTAAPATTQAAPAKTYEIKFSTYTPSVGEAADYIKEYKAKLEEKTKGQVKLTLYFSEALGKMPEEVRMLQTGIADLSVVNTGLHPADFPLCSVSELPFVMPSDRPLPLLTTLYEKYFSKEWKGCKILFPAYIEDLNIFTKSKVVNTLADLKGLQLRVPPSKAMSDTVKILGGTPVSIPAPETYSALEKGMVDGEVAGVTLSLAMKKYEVVKNATRISFNVGIQAMAMSENTWNSFPKEIQQAITELTPWAQQRMEEGMKKEIDKAFATFKEKGVNIVTVPPEERTKFIETSKPVVDAWIKDMDAKGLPASALINDLRAYKK